MKLKFTINGTVLSDNVDVEELSIRKGMAGQIGTASLKLLVDETIAPRYDFAFFDSAQYSLEGLDNLDQILIQCANPNLMLWSENLSEWTSVFTPVLTATTVEDDNGAQAELIKQIVSAATATAHVWTVWVLKDDVVPATRVPAFNVVVGDNYNVRLNTSTGASLTNGSLSATHSVVSEGDYWRLDVSFTTDDANGIQLTIYPSIGSNADLTTYDVAAVGTITIQKQQLILDTGDVAYRKVEGDADEGKVFSGYITNIAYEQLSVAIDEWTLECQDQTVLLDTTVINDSWTSSPPETDQGIIQDAFSNYLPEIDTSNVDSTETIVNFVAKDVTLRKMMDQLCEITNCVYFIDPDKNLYYGTAPLGDAGFDISDEPDESATYEYEMRSYRKDYTGRANKVTMLGAIDEDTGDDISATVQDGAHQATYGQVYAVTLLDRETTDPGVLALKASVELALRTTPVETGEFVTTKDGLNIADGIDITSLFFGVSGEKIIREMEIKTRSDAETEYTCTFGDYDPDLTALLRQMARVDHQLQTTTPPDGSIGDGKLDRTTDPIVILNADIANLNAGKLNAGTLSVDRLLAASIAASKLTIKKVIPVDLVLTDDDPGAGSVAWAECKIYWDGVEKTISAGNTDKKLIYWTTGGTSFTGADSVAPAANIFVIATNDDGASDEVWDKVGNKSVQEANLAFTLPGGYMPQQSGGTNFDLAVNDSGTIIDESDRGYLLHVGFEISETADAGNTDLDITITVDGGAPVTERIISGQANWFGIKPLAVNQTGTPSGGVNEDTLTLSYGIPYETSLKVEWEVSGATVTDGEMIVRLWRALKT